MKTLFLSLLSYLLFSCSDNHSHDGLYIKGLGITNSSSNEILKINGNYILSNKYSSGGEFSGEVKVPCIQFEDRIEFTEGGLTKILQVIDRQELKKGK